MNRCESRIRTQAGPVVTCEEPGRHAWHLSGRAHPSPWGTFAWRDEHALPR